MPTEHSAITDPEIHETKGVSSAVAGEALFCQTPGTSEWRQIDWSDVSGTPTFSVALQEELQVYSTTDQTVSAAATPTQVDFGGPVSSSNVDIDGDGTITFLNDGTYLLIIDLTCGKVGGSAGTRLFFRETLNGSIINHVHTVRFAGSNTGDEFKVQITSVIEASTNDVYELYFATDTNNTTGLVSNTLPVIAGWDTDSHSVLLRAYRFGA